MVPHLKNVLSQYCINVSDLERSTNFYTEVLDMRQLVDCMSDDAFAKRFKKLNEALTELVENYSLVSFIPLCIKSKERMLAVMRTVDKANGYAQLPETNGSFSKPSSTICQLLLWQLGGEEHSPADVLRLRPIRLRVHEDW